MKPPLYRNLSLIFAATIALTACGQETFDKFNALNRTVQTRDMPAFEKLLDEGTDLYVASPSGLTVASTAAERGQWEFLEKLFARGYDPLALTPIRKGEAAVYQRGLEILPHAASHGRLDWVKRLVEQGLDVDADKASGGKFDDPLTQALASRHLAVARYLLDAKAPITYRSHPDNKYGGFGVIHLAIWNRSLPLLDEFVRMGADINETTDHKITPLMLAAIYRWVEGFKYLLKAGASLTPQDYDNKDVSDYAKDNPALREALMKHKIGAGGNQAAAPEDELFLAIAAEDVVAVERLSRQPGLANAADKDGVPAIIHATVGGKVEIVRKLLAAGAKANVQSAEGNTPLYEAVMRKRADIVRALVEAGADPNLYDPAIWSPLERAINLKEFDAAVLLLEKGAKPDLPVDADRTRVPPLCLAAQWGHLQLVSLLLEKGANIHAVDSNGIGAMIYACNPSGNPAVLELLASRGLDINTVAPGGDTPLAIAVAFSSPAVVRKALELGAKPVALDRAISRLRRGNPQDEEKLSLLKTQDASVVTEAEFWRKNPSRDEIMAYIQQGGSPNYNGGKSPLFEAISRKDLELASFLLDHGANPNLSGDVHPSPLWNLAKISTEVGEDRAVETAKQMLQLGANPDGNPEKESKSIFLRTPPIDAAIYHGQVKFVELLLRSGADVTMVCALSRETAKSWIPKYRFGSANCSPGPGLSV